jgi:hypothetical protein
MPNVAHCVRWQGAPAMVLACPGAAALLGEMTASSGPPSSVRTSTWTHGTRGSQRRRWVGLAVPSSSRKRAACTTGGCQHPRSARPLPLLLPRDARTTRAAHRCTKCCSAVWGRSRRARRTAHLSSCPGVLILLGLCCAQDVCQVRPHRLGAIQQLRIGRQDVCAWAVDEVGDGWHSVW